MWLDGYKVKTIEICSLLLRKKKKENSISSLFLAFGWEFKLEINWVFQGE